MPGSLEIQNLVVLSETKVVDEKELVVYLIKLDAVPFDDFKGTVRFEYEADPVPSGGQPEPVSEYVEGDGVSDKVTVTQNLDTEAMTGNVTVTAFKNAEELDSDSTSW